ncbi:double-stranded RNA-binding protein 4-like [Triticum urartu]|uniref:DRBM domain-containing protein n=1 Tax=Triticum urartu TaxID=4572 RepID=A0A8R7RAU9_TRIUA|nr:double-stranded RNA-binding protein 4-like [Triticum urartu]
MDEHSYNAVEGQLSSHFVKSGSNVIIVTISCDEEGNNISKRGSHLDWYNGPTLLEALNQLKEPISTQGYYYRNKLETYCLRTYQMFPVYVTKIEGELHNLKFRSEVKVNDDIFCSLEAHLQRKEAELDAAQVACTSLLGKCDDVTLRIEKDELCAKSILREFALKSKSSLPVYSSSIVKELEMTYWKSSVLFEGVSYVSDDRAKNKRLSEQKAACAALKSILATEDHLLPSILVAKRKPTSAVPKSSRAAKKQKIGSE